MKFAIIGQGGHSKVLKDIILSYEENEIIGLFDDKFNVDSLVDPPYFGRISSAKKLIERCADVRFVVAIGNNYTRKLIVEQLGIPKEHYETLIHQSAVISPSAKIGEGCVVMANTVINADALIGAHSIINSGSVVEHDCKIGRFAHVCPNTTLTGAVHLDEGVLIGAGTTIIPNIKIGEWTIIGAGATVINNIPPFTTAVGIPAISKEKIIIGGV